MRALIIAYTRYAHDGRVKRHAQALAQRGDQVDVICLENPEQGCRNGINVIGVAQKRYRGSSRANYAGSYLRFFAHATLIGMRRNFRRPYDAVIACSIPDAVVLCALPLRLLGSKVVLDIHDTMPELYRDKFGGRRNPGVRLLEFEERASAWFADRVLAVHELHRRRLEAAGIRRDKIRVVINSPDSRVFAPRAKAELNCEDFTLVCHGTVTQRLGLDTAVEAVALARERIPGLKLKIIGSGDYAAQVRALVERKALQDLIEFHPAVALEQLPGALSSASAGIVPNIASESTHLMLPVKLLEYAALGIPVVASRLKTIEHYFGDRAVAFFEPGNARDLAVRLEELYRDPARGLELARNAGAALERISFEKQRQNFYSAIDSLLAREVETPMPAGR